MNPWNRSGIPPVSGITAAALVLLCGLAGPAGCSDPMRESHNDELRRSVIESARRESAPLLRLAEPPRGNPGINDPRVLERNPAEVTFPPERMKELEEMAGPLAKPVPHSDLGPDLVGQASIAFEMSLQQAVTGAVRNNLDVQVAQIEPAITGAELAAAQAAFDWVFFTNYQYQNTDEPNRLQSIGGVPVGSPANVNQRNGYTTGLRKPLTSGGQLTMSQGQNNIADTSPEGNFDPNTANTANVTFRLDQPLLRNFGSDVATAQIRLNRNAERASIQDLKGKLLTTITQTEAAYWRLVQARKNFDIQQRNLARGIETRDVLKGRTGFDARPAEISEAVATVERRRANTIRAVNQLRQASDSLKQLVNDPELTIGSESLVLPIDDTPDQPITFSLLDSIVAGIEHRPEVQAAILSIDDASIRQQVADNARLPQLDLALQAQLNGLDRSAGEAYDQVNEGRFADYLVSVIFEQPIGNRAAEAIYRRQQLERLRATVNYRKAVQQVVLDVKTALRNIKTNYQLIEQTRSARLAATENLRTLNVLEKTTQSMTPDFLDLKFRRQDAMAVAEAEEVGALVDYNISIAQLASATGQALERNQIKFVVPDGTSTDAHTGRQ